MAFIDVSLHVSERFLRIPEFQAKIRFCLDAVFFAKLNKLPAKLLYIRIPKNARFHIKVHFLHGLDVFHLIKFIAIAFINPCHFRMIGSIIGRHGLPRWYSRIQLFSSCCVQTIPDFHHIQPLHHFDEQWENSILFLPY